MMQPCTLQSLSDRQDSNILRRWVYTNYQKDRLLQWSILRPYYVAPYKVLRRIQQPQPGTLWQTPSVFDKCTGFFYTTHGINGFMSHPGTKQWLSVLLKCHGRGFEPTLFWSETPEFEFGALNRLAKSLPLLQDTSMVKWKLCPWAEALSHACFS